MSGQTTDRRPFLFTGGIAFGMSVAYQDVEGWTGRTNLCAAVAMLILIAPLVANAIRGLANGKR